MISRINSELKMQRDVEGLNEQAVEHKLKPAIIPFAGRIGGNQDYVVDRSNPCNAELLAKVPDAAPLRTYAIETRKRSRRQRAGVCECEREPGPRIFKSETDQRF